ncbi:hypothetical protein NC651_030341 [Populus alba x Populus x berolinensis]|nr:hypothetical protein NC651_030341 [Populus alba x Populus x berolinensis]
MFLGFSPSPSRESLIVEKDFIFRQASSFLVSLFCSRKWMPIADILLGFHLSFAYCSRNPWFLKRDCNVPPLA